MEFKHVLVDAQEARALASSEPADLHVRVLIVLLDELIQLGYAVDGTTTPGSFIITW